MTGLKLLEQVGFPVTITLNWIKLAWMIDQGVYTNQPALDAGSDMSDFSNI